MPSKTKSDVAGTAKLLVVLLGFAWGFNWIATNFALREVQPWSLRLVTTAVGALTLIAAASLSGRKLAITAKQAGHIAVAGLLNVSIFNICSVFAQLFGATSRAVAVAYSMPIWATALSWLVLGERLDTVRIVALGLCITGLTILVWPLLAAGIPLGVFFALGCAFGWAGATVYLKWANIDVDPLVNAMWQLVFGTAPLLVGALAIEGLPRIWPVQTVSIVAMVYIALLGVGLAQFLWWSIVGKLPIATASLGSLLVPVVGITASTVILGERPTITDIIGFVSIFAAAACVLLQRKNKSLRTEMPE